MILNVFHIQVLANILITFYIFIHIILYFIHILNCYIHTEAVALLQAHVADKKITFEHYPEWGDDLGSEHERYMTDKVFLKPTIVYNYPKGIKAFYMKLNDDNMTVAAMDILVPKIGEMIGGSQREDRLDVLERRCIECGLHPKDLWWYSDLRRYGSVPHAGFGLGFERLIMFITGIYLSSLFFFININININI